MVIYLSKPYLAFAFGRFFNTDKIKRFVCDVIQNTCGYYQVPDCVEALNRLPVAQGEQFVDGNSYGCRVLHAAFAFTNPERHCPHVSFLPIPDMDGNVICQGEGGKNDPNDFFDEDDFQYYRRVAKRKGFDPEQGFKVLPL